MNMVRIYYIKFSKYYENILKVLHKYVLKKIFKENLSIVEPHSWRAETFALQFRMVASYEKELHYVNNSIKFYHYV